jgi:hypothetical protein
VAAWEFAHSGRRKPASKYGASPTPTIEVRPFGLHKGRIEIIGCFAVSIYQNHSCINERIVMINQYDPLDLLQESIPMSDVGPVERRPIQVTIWDILGETPTDLRKPINPLISSSLLTQTDKNIRKNSAKVQLLFDHTGVRF